MGTVPPGQIMVPWEASLKASVIAPAFVALAAWYGPPSVCPPVTL